MKKLRVTVEGKAYEVLVEVLDEGEGSRLVPAPVAAPALTPTAAPPASTAPSAAPRAAAGDIVSPLAGKVVSIDVAMGQSVKPGDQLATIEAMKMNTFVFADGAGKVTAILAQAGGAVEEGAPLLRLG